jgi:hypothetical protein
LVAGCPFSRRPLPAGFVAVAALALAETAVAEAALGWEASLAGPASLAGVLPLALSELLDPAFCALAGVGFADVAPPAFAESALEDLWATGTVFSGAFETTAAPAFFAVVAFAAVERAEASVGAAAFFDDSTAVLAAAAFADALEAFAFTLAPFFVSGGTTVVGTIGLSCRGEGDRR